MKHPEMEQIKEGLMTRIEHLNELNADDAAKEAEVIDTLADVYARYLNAKSEDKKAWLTFAAEVVKAVLPICGGLAAFAICCMFEYRDDNYPSGTVFKTLYNRVLNFK